MALQTHNSVLYYILMFGASIWMYVMYIFLFISIYFEVFMLLSFLNSRRRGAHISQEPLSYDELPTVAVIVPCFNEGKTVASTIESLLALEYPHEKIEIIVVDDGSRDNTLQVASTYKNDSRVRVFHKENGGKHTAMNYGLDHTDAYIIGCLDADSIVASDALQQIVPLFVNPKVAAVTPGILIKKPENTLQYMQHAEYSLSVFNRFTLASIGSMFITPGPFSFFRTQIVRSMGGWKHGYSTEDLEMAMRLQDARYLIANAPAATVYTGTPRTLMALFRQRVRWTYGFLRNSLEYRHMFGNRKYGNLGIIVLPTALISIGIAIFFFLRILYNIIKESSHILTRAEILGFSFDPSFDLFYVNTSAIWILIFFSVGIVVWLISFGSELGRGTRRLPLGTPLFVAFYSFLVPLWLMAAVVRATFKTGVKWR